MFFDILYNILIYPIEFVIEILFYLFNNVFRSSYGVSLFLLSICINFLSLPLYNIAESWQAKERAIQDKMKPMIDNIKAVYKGDQRYLLIRACQRINGYKTIYAFRGTLGLLIQIPFFMAAYNFVHSLTGLNGQSFLFIKDLSKPDALIHIGSISINLLPFLMTLFSLLAGFVYAKKLKFKESLPLYIVSLIFLVLLYTSPSGLLFYWTINCLFSLVKNIVIEYKLYNVFIVNKNKLLKAYNIFFIIVTILFILLISLGKIERKAYLSDFIFMGNNNYYLYSAKVKYYSKIFISSDIFEFRGNVNKFTKHVKKIEFNGLNTKNAIVELNKDINTIKENIDIYYTLSLKSYSINIYTFFLILTFIINIGNVYRFIFKNKEEEFSFTSIRDKLIVISCIIISILSGLFIPTSLIGNSPQEFTNPFYLIFNNLSMSIGLFLLYPLFMYVLFSEKIKNYITILFIFVTFIVLIDTFIMTGNYVNINSDLIFNNTDLLKASYFDILKNLFFILIVFSIVFVLLKKSKIVFLLNLFLIILLSILSVSVFNTINIAKLSSLSNVDSKSILDDEYQIFNLSRNGKNIFVFLIDTAVPGYWIDAMSNRNDYYKEFDGFTFFPNTLSFGDFTITVSAVYGGYDYLPYEMSINGNYNLKEKHNESLLAIPLALKQYNYKTTILNPEYVNWEYSADLNIFEPYSNDIKAYKVNNFIDYSVNKYFNNENINYNSQNILVKKKNIFRFSIFRMMLVNLRYDFYDDKKWFNPDNFNINLSILNYALLYNINDFVKIKDDGNYYNYFHSQVIHDPFYYNDDFLPSLYARPIPDKYLNIYKNDFSVRHFYGNVVSMNLIIKFINFLKKENLYDNTKIILVSDHGNHTYNQTFFNNTYYRYFTQFNSLLMCKDFNSRGELKIDTNFSTVADASYLATKHIENIKNPFNGKIITNDYKTNGVYVIELLDPGIKGQYSNRYNFNIFYYVKDNIFNTNNWKKFKIDWKTKESDEIKLE